MSRLPSHGLRFGSPPKLHGHDTVQLQLSATVAVMCQVGAAARGAVKAARMMATAAKEIRMTASVALQPARVNRNGGRLRRPDYSARSAVTGFTSVARTAGT